MLSSAIRFRARGTVVLSLFVLALVSAACGGSPTGIGPGAALGPAPAASAAPGVPAAGPNEQPGEDQGNDNGDGGSLAGGPTAPDGLLIIKTGEIALQVAGLDPALTSANQLIVGLGGYSSGSERFGDGDRAQASVTYRVPAARWDEALAGIRGLAEKVLTERSSTQDVTSQVVDLGARIANLQATERALQAIMDRATAIKDVLTVQAELTKTRSEIEQLAAQKLHFEGQAAFSTVTVTFALKPDPILAEQEGFDAGTEVEQASASLVSILQGLATAGIWFGIVWLPILLALAILFGVGYLVARRLRHSGIGSAGDTPAPAPDAGA
jgi:Domain of unknown function (DUF4349)